MGSVFLLSVFLVGGERESVCVFKRDLNPKLIVFTHGPYIRVYSFCTYYTLFSSQSMEKGNPYLGGVEIFLESWIKEQDQNIYISLSLSLVPEFLVQNVEALFERGFFWGNGDKGESWTL